MHQLEATSDLHTNLLDEVISDRLKYLYFGLLLLGIGSGLYSIFAPEELKQHPLVADYVNRLEGISTNGLTKSSLDRVLKAYLSYGTDEQRSGFYGGSDPLSFPFSVSARLHSFINDIFEQTDDFESVETGEGDSSQRTSDMVSQSRVSEDSFPIFYTGSGYVNTQAVIEAIYANPKVIWYYTRPLIATAVRHKKDVFFLEYSVLNYSRYWIRVIIAFCFCMGFLLLLVPTAATSLRLLLLWLM